MRLGADVRAGLPGRDRECIILLDLDSRSYQVLDMGDSGLAQWQLVEANGPQ